MDGDLKSWEVEQLRRSVAMLPPQAPNALNREQALKVLDQLRRAVSLLERQESADRGAADPRIR